MIGLISLDDLQTAFMSHFKFALMRLGIKNAPHTHGSMLMLC